MRHITLRFIWVKYLRTEVNSEPVHFHTFMDNGKAFLSLDGMACSCQCPEQLPLISRHWQAKRHWITSDLQKPKLLENNHSNTSNNMKSKQTQKEQKYTFVELLTPKLKNIY